MINEIRDSAIFLLTNKEQFNFFSYIMTKVGEQIVEIENDSIFNQLLYADYSPTREKWMLRSIVFENSKTIYPLLPVMTKLCEENNIEMDTGQSDGVICIGIDDEVFTFTF